MPSDPDNKRMDRALNAYAKRRRDEAGPPFDLHPASRQLLQSEVGRAFPRPASEPQSWFQAAMMFRPRLVFAAAVFAVLGLVCWVSFSSFRSASQPISLAKNNDSKEPLLDAPKDTPRPEMPAGAARRGASGEKAAPLESRSRQAADRDVEGLLVLKQEIITPPAPNSPPTSSPRATPRVQAPPASDVSRPNLGLALNAPATPPAAPMTVPLEVAEAAKEGLKLPGLNEVRADGAQPLAAGGGGGLDGIATRRATTEALYFQTAPQPSGALGARLTPDFGTVRSDVVTVSESFKFRRELGQWSDSPATAETPPRGLRARSVARDVEDARTTASQNILAFFDFDQNGDSIRIRDADGSVYDGKTLSATEADKLATGPGDDKNVQQQVQAGRESEVKRLSGRSRQNAETSLGRSLQFHVSGTNHNLKQLVVLDGVMTAEDPAPGQARTNERTAARGFTDPARTRPGVTPEPAASTRGGIELEPSSTTAALKKSSDPVSVPLSRIRARARIGAATNEVEIIAIRVPR